MKKTAQVVLINKEGLILGVSRKDDHYDFGLIGGKMDPEDNDNPTATAIRECKEETGLDIHNLRLIFAIHKDGFMGYTYLADYSGEISFDEPHVVKWQPMEVLVNGKFGKYNKLVSESMNDMGIDYIYDVDINEVIKDVTSLISNNIFNVSIRYILKDNSLNLYNIFLEYIDNENNIYTYLHDEEILDKELKTLSIKYGIILKIDYSHYIK